MENPIHKPNRRALVRIGIRQFNMELPYATFERCLSRALEADKELLPLIIVSKSIGGALKFMLKTARLTLLKMSAAVPVYN
jgi:hypothetical protein